MEVRWEWKDKSMGFLHAPGLQNTRPSHRYEGHPIHGHNSADGASYQAPWGHHQLQWLPMWCCICISLLLEGVSCETPFFMRDIWLCASSISKCGYEDTSTMFLFECMWEQLEFLLTYTHEKISNKLSTQQSYCRSNLHVTCAIQCMTSTRHIEDFSLCQSMLKENHHLEEL